MHIALAVLVAIVTMYAGAELSPWLFVPGAVLFVLLVMAATDLIEYIAIQRALRGVENDQRFTDLTQEADRMLAEGMAEEAEEAYMQASEHREEPAVVIAQYMHMAKRCREMGDYQEAKKWLTRAKQLTRA
jgi:uncharacterized protein HemY